MENCRPRCIAFYLPQYHPVQENDEWWGKGFTEWTNVTKAQKRFKNHYQPHLPADLGFYDLRLPEARQAQADLAKEYGIYGFCYYHYWFNGRRILERPFQEVFESGKPDFPFMLCWANENWSRTWDGADTDILLEQKYSENDDREHILNLLPYFEDKRYIRIQDKPVIAIYSTWSLPNPKRTVEIWREEAAKRNTELYICRIDGHGRCGEQFLKNGGFDAAIDFEPFGCFMKSFHEHLEEIKVKKKKKNRIRYGLSKTYAKLLNQKGKLHGHYDYEEYVDFIKTQSFPNYKIFPGISPSWDNTARKKNNYFLFENASPQKYAEWLEYLVSNFKPYSEEENFLFINAWNEWGEGNHLEPDQKWGRAYLEKTKEIIGPYFNKK